MKHLTVYCHTLFSFKKSQASFITVPMLFNRTPNLCVQYYESEHNIMLHLCIRWWWRCLRQSVISLQRTASIFKLITWYLFQFDLCYTNVLRSVSTKKVTNFGVVNKLSLSLGIERSRGWVTNFDAVNQLSLSLGVGRGWGE